MLVFFAILALALSAVSLQFYCYTLYRKSH